MTYIQKKILIPAVLLLAILFSGCGRAADSVNDLPHPDPMQDRKSVV